ncbi:MAG: Asd/ArgC dimerization domain-containing protein [Bryobacteraceae bacterium]
MALVGSETLLGREIRDSAASSAPEIDFRLIAGDETHAGSLTRFGDEPAILFDLAAASLADMRAVFLAGSEVSSRKALEFWDRDPGAAVIDLTCVAEERPDARLRAPSVESEPESAGSAVYVVAHPAAIALALFFRGLSRRGAIRRSVVQILAPASEHGAAGVEELQGQTVSLLSFKNMPKAVFDAELGFNLLARYGEDAPASLEAAELRIERHLATLLALPGEGADAPMPSLRVVQAPVFHGYSFSAWVEFGGAPDIEALESGLASEWIEVRGRDVEPPTNVGQAGQRGVSVGAIAADRNAPGACWFWLVADNLRLAADNAVAVARQVV